MIKKSDLKKGYYYEEKPWYDACPDELEEPEEFKMEIFPRIMTHAEILKEYNIAPYSSYAEAAVVFLAVIPRFDKNCKGQVVYFTDDGILYRFLAWRRGGGRLYVGVRKVDLGIEYDPGDGVAFRNSPSVPSGNSALDSLTLPDRGSVKELEILIYKELLAKLNLKKAQQEFGNEYVFGYDDVVRIINYEIEK